MAGPITWQNVVGPSLADASRPLEVATNGFRNSFDQLGAILAQRESVDAQNVLAQRQANTQDFQDKLFSQFKSPEELAAGIKSGAVDALRAQYGNVIDRQAVRGAPEALLAQRYAQTQAANSFNDQQLDRAEMPIRDDIVSNIAMGKMDVAKQLLNENQVRNKAALYQALDTRGQTEVERGRATTKFDQEGKKFADDLLTTANQRANSTAQVAIAGRNADTNARMTNAQIAEIADNRDERKELRTSAKLAAAAAANRQSLSDQGNMFADGVYNGNSAIAMVKELKDAGLGQDPVRSALALDRIKTGMIEIDNPNGKGTTKVPVSASAVKAAFAATAYRWHDVSNSGYADRVEEKLKEIMSQTYKTSDGNQRSKAADDLANFSRALTKSKEDPQIKPIKSVR